MSFLEVNSLYKNFGKIEVLKNVCFTLERGEVLSIIGSSGCGKTTLLRCLNLLETPDSGTVMINGNVIFDGITDEKLDVNELRRRRLHLGLVFQQFNLFPQYNIFENVCLAPKLYAAERPDFNNNKKEIYAEIEANAEALIERVGLSNRKEQYPYQLSGGQQQRVAIARALAMRPDVLCFDEPTSALDPELTGEVLNVIKSLKTGDMTMIVVTHEMEFARRVSDKAIFISHGVIDEEGAPDDVFLNPKSETLKSFLSKSLENK